MELVFEELFDLPPEDTHTASPSGKFLVMVIYDIIDNKRRLKVSKILNGYGKRVQKSAFECIIDKKQYDALVEKLTRVISDLDLLRVYRIAGSADVKVWGDVAITAYEEDIII